MIDFYQSVIDDIYDKLDDKTGEDQYGCDLHHELCNTDYFIIGRHKATEALGSDVFEATSKIKEYEQTNFGEVSTDFSEPEKVVNMLAYIIGEEVLQESKTVQDNWDTKLNGKQLGFIQIEIEALSARKLYNENA